MFSFRRRNHSSEDVIFSIFKVTYSNFRFNALDTLTVVVHSVRIN